MKPQSLHFKINLVILVTAAVVASLFGAVLYPFEARRYDTQVERIHQLLDTVYLQKSDELANELFAGQERALLASLEEILQVGGMAAVSVHLPDGEVFLSTDDRFRAGLPEPERRILAARPSTFVKRVIGERSLGVYARRIQVIGREIGYIRMYYDFARLEAEVSQSILLWVILAGTTLVLMAVLLHSLLSRLVIGPVTRLRTAMHLVEEGHLGETVRLSSVKEIGEMGVAFNKMSLRLKEVRENLVKAESKYRSIFENAIEGIFQSSPEKGSYITVNPSMARSLGYESAEEFLESVSDIPAQVYARPEDRETIERLLEAEGKVIGYEAPLLRKDGSRIWVSVSCRKVRDDSGIRFYEGSFVDITERREKEQAERAREAAEAASRAKSAFVANMSHEIRTPINVILGFTELLGPMVADPKGQRYLSSIRSSGGALMSLINDILDLSKIEAGKMEFAYEPVRLRSIVDEVASIFHLQLDGKGLDFTVDLSDELPDKLLLDEVRLRQILFNLVGNAVKFTDSGTIALSARPEQIHGDGTLDLCITVSDTGPGIPPEARQEIFNSFTQKTGERSREYGGTGLGLTISKALVEAMGGTISVESDTDRGAAFTIRLPRIGVAAPGETAEAEAAPGRKGRRLEGITLLVVDDREINRTLMRGFAQGHGITVIEAEGGAAGVEMARTYRPDVVLMDIKMPGMDGYTAAETIRNDPRLEGIPIIALTASGMKEEEDRLKAAGFQGYLIRPFEREALVELVRRVVAGAAGKTSAEPGGQAEGSEERTPPAPIPVNAAEAAHRLETELMPVWKSAHRRQRIPDIESFARRLKDLGEAHRLSILSEFAENLLFHVGGFDIDRIMATMSAYPDLVEQIKKLARR